MSDPSEPKPATLARAEAERLARQAREAAALRENLRRRKQQARAREAPAPAEPEPDLGEIDRLPLTRQPG